MANGVNQGPSSYSFKNPYSYTLGTIFALSSLSLSRNASKLSKLRPEQRENAVPPLKSYLPNINQYDVILLGYCNWWASIPAPVRSFLKHYDFSGKTIIPFCSHGGGFFGQTISAITKLAPNSRIGEGLSVHYSSYSSSAIKKWQEQNGIR
jgi:hypothetical protein